MKTHQDQSTQRKRAAGEWWLLGCLTLCLVVSGALWPAAQAFQNTREVRVVNTTAAPGSDVTIALELVAQGNEATVQFSLTFSNAILTNPRVVRGSAVPTAPTVNSSQVANGRLGLFIELPQGQTFPAGLRQLATVTFTIPANAPSGATTIGFGDQPIAREIGDLNFSVLPVTFTPGTVTVQSSQPNPVPTLTNLNPNSVAAGSAAFTLTVTGTNFVNGASVRWNGSNRPTTFIDSTRVTAAIPASDLTAAGAASITVFNPAPGGGTSTAATLTISALAVSVSAASFVRDLAAPEMIIAMFGVDLATEVKIADTVPLPTTLAGTTVKVRDSLGVDRNAPLFFVAPSQINYLVPAGTATGTATLLITTANNKLSSGTINVQAVAPGLFAANSNGQGVPAAVLLRLKADGQRLLEEITQVQNGVFVPAPIDLGPTGEQVYLILFGTGFRGRSSQSAVTVSIGGTNMDVLYAGAQGDLVGLDQINIGPLPRSLAGRGNVNVEVTIDGKMANSGTVSIK